MNVLIEESTMKAIADKLREKAGATEEEKFYPIEFVDVLDTFDVLIGEHIDIEPSTSPRQIDPSEGYTGITRIYVAPVTRDIDSNIEAYNIKKGVTILGVTGVMEENTDNTLHFNLFDLKVPNTAEKWEDLVDKNVGITVDARGIVNFLDYLVVNVSGTDTIDFSTTYKLN